MPIASIHRHGFLILSLALVAAGPVACIDDELDVDTQVAARDPSPRSVRCQNPAGCKVEVGYNRWERSSLGLVPWGTAMGVFLVDQPVAVVSYPMADWGYKVQMADLTSRRCPTCPADWAPEASGVGGPPPPGDGANYHTMRCISSSCYLAAARDTADLPAVLSWINALGPVPRCTKVGVFFGIPQPRPPHWLAVSYPMPDRGGDVQWALLTDRAEQRALSGHWQTGRKDPRTGAVTWDPIEPGYQPCP